MKAPIELTSQSPFAHSVNPWGCSAVFHHTRSFGKRSLCVIVDSFVMVVAKVHSRNTSVLRPLKTSMRRVRARSLELRCCFDRWAKDAASSWSNLQHDSNASFWYFGSGWASSSNVALSISSRSKKVVADILFEAIVSDRITPRYGRIGWCGTRKNKTRSDRISDGRIWCAKIFQATLKPFKETSPLPNQLPASPSLISTTTSKHQFW